MKPHHPPYLASRLARLFLHDVDADVVLGDLEETYHWISDRHGQSAARRWYWSQIIRSLPNFMSKTLLWSSTMFKYYLLIALRIFRRQKVYTTINVLGLAVGLACCALIALFIGDELSYDRFHENSDRIYRINLEKYGPDGSHTETHANHSMSLGPALQADLPGIETYVRFAERDLLIQYRDQEPIEQPVLFADPAFFSTFTFPLLEGQAATALQEPNHVILTQQTARLLFGTEDPMGRTLKIRISDGYEGFIVAGIAEEPPTQSSIEFGIVVPFQRILDESDWMRRFGSGWEFEAFPTYVLLQNQTDAASLEAELAGMYTRYYPGRLEVPSPPSEPDTTPQEAPVPSVEEQVEEAPPALEEEIIEETVPIPEETDDIQAPTSGFPLASSTNRYVLQPLKDVHLGSEVRGGLSVPGNSIYSLILGAIGLAVLLLACINFMTLAVGRSTSRSREVGIRKTIGAHRHQLMAQFWGEALLLSGMATLLAVLLARLALPVFNDFAGKSLELDLFGYGPGLAILIGLMLFTGLVAGSYPALVLSGFQPIETLSGLVKLRNRPLVMKFLVTAQFAVSVGLICGTFIMLDQLSFLRSRSLGFDRDQVVMIASDQTDAHRAIRLYRNELADDPNIMSVSGMSGSLTRGWMRVSFDYENATRTVYLHSVDPEFIDLLDIRLVEGRNFNPNLASDSTRSVLVNETLVRAMGWTDPIGQVLKGYTEQPSTDPVVIGVVQDFHFQSLHNVIRPMMLTLDTKMNPFQYVLVRISPTDISATLTRLRSTWNDIAPDIPFTYNFLDDEIDRIYQTEERWSRIVAGVALLAVIIACMGLFGLSTLTISGRTKEIGIRKVMGAPVYKVFLLLSKDFIRLVLLGTALALPVTYLVMESWLTTFAYRITPGFPTFFLTTLTAILIAWLTISYQTIKAASVNPVECLRYE